MPSNFKIFYAFVLGISFHHVTPVSPKYFPLFIRLLWDNKEWQTTCQSLENNDQYQQLKTKIGSNIEKLVLPTEMAQQLLKENKIRLESHNAFMYEGLDFDEHISLCKVGIKADIIDTMKTQIKLNDFLIENNFVHLEPAQKFYLSEIDGEFTVLSSLERNLSECLFAGKGKERVHLTTEEADEWLRFIEKTGYVYIDNMAEDKQTHCLDNWYSLSSKDFKYTDSLEALGDFARKMDPEYGSRGHPRRPILNKESMDKLKERIFALTKKCTHENNNPKWEYFKECYITPLSEVELPE